MRAFLLLWALAGCTTTATKLRTRFAHQHGCTEAETSVREDSATHYRASGCGVTTEYVCPSFASTGSDAYACEEQGSVKKPGGEPKPMPGPNAPPDPPGPSGK